MLIWLSALASGLMLSAFFPQLPQASTCLGLVLCALLATIASVIYRGKRSGRRVVLVALIIHSLAGVLLGVSLGLLRAHQVMAQLLPSSFDGSYFCVVGEVVGLPQWQETSWRFYFESQPTLHCDAEKESANKPIQTLPHAVKKLRLSWEVPLDDDGRALRALESGSIFHFIVRLKRPRGLVNPGGFDYQRWLMARGVGAVGQVKTQDLTQVQVNHSLDRFRQGLGKDINEFLSGIEGGAEHAGLLIALLLGEKRGIEPEQMERMKSTGTLHLIAISGMHIGVAALVGRVLGGTLGRVLIFAGFSLTSVVLGRVGAFAFALAYSALAGFSLPTVRALTMLCVFLLAQTLVRPQSIYFTFLVAMTLVLILEPLAPFDAGFYLSFAAVFCLIATFTGSYGVRGLKAFVLAQKRLFVALLLPLCYFVEGSAVLAPLANLFAIPLVSLVLVPANFLLALSIYFDWEGLSGLAAQICLFSLQAMLQWLGYLRASYVGNLYLASAQLNGWVIGIAVVASLICLLPRGFPGRHFAYLGFMPFVFGSAVFFKSDKPLLALRVLDVGQGLAIHIDVQGTHLLYDTGAKFSPRFDIGLHVLLPYLKSQNVEALHSLIVSHEDLDHAGGAAAILEYLPLGTLYRSFTPSKTNASTHINCHQAKPWNIGEAHFEFLSVSPAGRKAGNNSSCVLLIEVGPHVILLPGDLERDGEFALLQERQPLKAPISLMLAPHHGSQTSSSYTWLYHWRPRHIAVSAGFGNAYGHPHHKVLKRYRLLGADFGSTAEFGALNYEFYPQSEGAQVKIYAQRLIKPRYWYRETPALFSD